MKDLDEILLVYPKIEKYKEKYECCDPLYNNRWREELQKKEIVKLFNIMPNDFILSPPGTTADFIAKLYTKSGLIKITNGEMKAQWFEHRIGQRSLKRLSSKNLGGICFDKQNDRIRRESIYKYDALIYSSFLRTPEILFSVIILGLDNVKLIHPLFERAQEDKVKEIKLCEEINKRLSRDDIKISIFEIIKLLSDDSMTIVYKGVKITKEKFLSLVIKK